MSQIDNVFKKFDKAEDIANAVTALAQGLMVDGVDLNDQDAGWNMGLNSLITKITGKTPYERYLEDSKAYDRYVAAYNISHDYSSAVDFHTWIKQGKPRD